MNNPGDILSTWLIAEIQVESIQEKDILSFLDNTFSQYYAWDAMLQRHLQTDSPDTHIEGNDTESMIFSDIFKLIQKDTVLEFDADLDSWITNNQ